MTNPDPRVPSFVTALDADSPRERTEAASSLGDLLRGEVHADDYAHAVVALLRRASAESDPTALEALLFTLSEAVDRPGSGALDWDPLLPLLSTVSDPECLGYVLTSLGLARHQRYRAAITPFLSHQYPSVREAATDAIAELDHTG